MRSTILKYLHSAHQGIVKTVERAKTSLYWPGMQKQIADLIETCDICQENRSTNRHEPLMPQEGPAYPQQKITAELLTVGSKDYMVSVDYYSKWINITELKATKSAYVIEALQRQFADFGIPEELVLDNGPQFGSWEFRLFMQSWGIVHRTSSPTYARPNGQAERMVQVAKNLIKKSSAEGTSYHLGLQEIRNTLITNGMLTPAQLLQGRTLRSKIPAPEKTLFPHTYYPARVKQALEKKIDDHKFYHDKKAGPEKEILKPGNQVRVHLQGTPARYTCKVHLQGTPARYTCKASGEEQLSANTCLNQDHDDGTRYRRNRMHINRNYGLPMARRELFRTMQATAPNNVSDASTATGDIARPPELSQPSRPPEKTQPTSQPSSTSDRVYTRRGREVKPPQWKRTMSRTVY